MLLGARLRASQGPLPRNIPWSNDISKWSSEVYSGSGSYDFEASISDSLQLQANAGVSGTIGVLANRVYSGDKYLLEGGETYRWRFTHRGIMPGGGASFRIVGAQLFAYTSFDGSGSSTEVLKLEDEFVGDFTDSQDNNVVLPAGTNSVMFQFYMVNDDTGLNADYTYRWWDNTLEKVI